MALTPSLAGFSSQASELSEDVLRFHCLNILVDCAGGVRIRGFVNVNVEKKWLLTVE